MQKTILIVVLSMLLPVAFFWTKIDFIHRVFLVFSNFAMVPALKQAVKHKAWFEASFILMMGTVSIVYHTLFDLTEIWGVKFRHGDWALALTAPYVLLHYVFRRDDSHFKTIANFWAVYVSYFLAIYFQGHIIVYCGILGVYSLGLIYFKDRHFSKIPRTYLIWTFVLMTLGVVLFMISDIVLYWVLHTYWHYAAFLGMYWIIKIGPSEGSEVKEEIVFPISQAPLQRVVVHNGTKYDFQ